MYRFKAVMMLFVIIVSIIVSVIMPGLSKPSYKLTALDRNILPTQDSKLAQVLKLDDKQENYLFNQGYTGKGQTPEGQARFTASLPVDAANGITVTDVNNSLDFTMKPNFSLGQGRQDGNQIMYPLENADGFLVYTNQVAGVKEDILLNQYSRDSIRYDFTLKLPSNLEARLEKDGSVGVYGTDMPINGAVSTGTTNDAALLEKLRAKAPKNKLMFNIPAPVVSETNKTASQVKVRYQLHGDTLSIEASKLKGASYPLAIDPSVYVATAEQFMRGNNETNIDFDTTDELIQKGKLSGGRFDNWLNTTTLPNNRNNMGTAVAGGYIYVVGGMQGTSRVSTVYWAKFNPTTNTIDAPNPGNGACTNWCTNTAYDLPVATSALSLVAYNGFLYVLGGETNSGRTNAVYIAKLGVNGEPSLWNPTDTNKANWVYWYQATGLSTERSYSAAAAYNNRMYLIGGSTNASPNGVSTVEEADINPIGTLGTWNTTGMVSLPSVRRSHTIQIYNDRMYLVGGISNGAVQSSVQYIKINNDGTLAGSWVSTTPMLNPRFSDGGTFSTIWGGYLYVAGGCSAISSSGYWCSATGMSTDRDIELASINADGSLTAWTAINGLTYQRSSYGLVSWRQTLYGIGGCTSPNETTGLCATDTNVTTYGKINQDGDVSTTNPSYAVGSGTCTGTSPTNCNLPPAGANAGQIGQMASGVAINNGYIYIVGGCYNISSGTDCASGSGFFSTGYMSDNTAYSSIAADGSLVSPAACSGTRSGNWCVDSTHTINGGLGAEDLVVFNNMLYTVGGTTGSQWVGGINEVGLNDDGSLSGNWTNQSYQNLGIGSFFNYGFGFSYAFTRANPSNNTLPGNLYIIGGCISGNYQYSSGISCLSYKNFVLKCWINTTGAVDTNTGCTTTGQMQLDSEPNTAGSQGLAGMAGCVYANYIYLIGGTSDNESTRGSVLYAKIDNNNNIVSADGNGAWIQSPNEISPARLRGTAFGYNGYLYSLAGYSGTGSLNDVLFAKIDVSDGSIGTFTTSLVTVNPRWQLGSIVANGFVYAFGGCSSGPAPTGCTALTPTIQTFQLYNNYSGTPENYASSTNTIGVDRIGGSTAILNGYIYYAAGCSVITCTTATNNVYYAPLSPDGSIGAWAVTGSLPDVRAWGKLLATGNTLYYIGGQNSGGTAQSTVYYAAPSSGAISTWSTATNGLPAARAKIGAAVWNNRLYVTGGINGGTYQNTIYVSPSLPNGGDITAAWSSTNGFNDARDGHITIAYANNLYILGGYDGSIYMNDVQFAKIASDGTVSGWTFTTSLPQRVYGGDGFAANGYMYVIGGTRDGTNCTNNTYVAPISANTTIASGNNPTGVGDWSQTNVEYNGNRYGVAAAYDQGRTYVLGGGCSAFVGATDRTYVTTLQSQPQVAKYSRMIDTDTDVFPTYWLMNGLDNDIGARWKMKYRSSTSATAAWGQETNFGTVPLGTPETYTPLDSSGTNTNFARYFYLSVSIDSSQAFGYPEDVTRGPTAADITLFFTSDPSKRLRHGATFTGGELQPLDTPPYP